MIMNFEQAFTKLLGHEGGYSNNPIDPGGATMWGVTEKVARQNGYMGDMRDYPQDAAKKLYRQTYWDSCQADSLPADIRFDVFDGAVNSGVAQSVRWLQRAIGAEADGKVGPQTIRMSLNQPNLLAKYNGYRLLFMTQLKVWPTFSGGWAKRIAYNLIGD